MSRQNRCIAIVATQSLSSLKSALPGETWRTLLQTFRTKVFLALSDDFSAKVASELCGTGRTPRAAVPPRGEWAGCTRQCAPGTRHGPPRVHQHLEDYGVQRDAVLRSKVFTGLRNAGDRARLRRLESVTADVLLSEAPLSAARGDVASSSWRPEGVTRMSFEIICRFSVPLRRTSRTPT